MSKIDKGDLLSGSDIPFEQICTLRAVKLKDIRPGSGIGFASYYQHIQLLSLDEEEAFSAMGLAKEWQELPSGQRQAYPLFAVLIASPPLRELLGRALSFFVCERVEYSEKAAGFLLYRPAGPQDPPLCVGRIDRENYDRVRDGILQMNGLSSGKTGPLTFQNQKAREIYEKVQRHRRRADKRRRQDGSISLPNIIGAVAARHPGYSLLNIWELTIFQLYDQFARLNRYHQVQVSAQRWAAWGKDPFDFALWYKDIDP